MRLQNILPQTFSVSLIEIGQETRVRTIELSEDNQGEIEFSIDDVTYKVILVVSGTTPITRQRAIYQYNVKWCAEILFFEQNLTWSVGLVFL